MTRYKCWSVIVNNCGVSPFISNCFASFPFLLSLIDSHSSRVSIFLRLWSDRTSSAIVVHFDSKYLVLLLTMSRLSLSPSVYPWRNPCCETMSLSSHLFLLDPWPSSTFISSRFAPNLAAYLRRQPKVQDESFHCSPFAFWSLQESLARFLTVKQLHTSSQL